MLQGSLWGYKINGVETSVELFTASVDAKKTANTKAPFIEELWYYHLLGPKQAKAMRLQVREAARLLDVANTEKARQIEETRVTKEALEAAEPLYTRELAGIVRPRMVEVEDLNIVPDNETAEAKTLRLLTLSLSRLIVPNAVSLPVKIQKQTHFFGNGQDKENVMLWPNSML